jgi:hypothetical protein
MNSIAIQVCQDTRGRRPGHRSLILAWSVHRGIKHECSPAGACAARQSGQRRSAAPGGRIRRPKAVHHHSTLNRPGYLWATALTLGRAVGEGIAAAALGPDAIPYDTPVDAAAIKNVEMEGCVDRIC